MWKDDARLLDILLAAREIESFVEGVDEAGFEQNRMLQHALMRLLTIIGEAANKISPEMRAAHSEIPWRAIIGMRNRLVHDYLHVDMSLVWDTVKQDIPVLLAGVTPLVPPESD
jgi:uncharacterized protein with HEPN domain